MGRVHRRSAASGQRGGKPGAPNADDGSAHGDGGCQGFDTGRAGARRHRCDGERDLRIDPLRAPKFGSEAGKGSIHTMFNALQAMSIA